MSPATCISVRELRQGHSYSIYFSYGIRSGYITGEMRAEFVGKTNEGAFAFRLDKDRPYIALPAEFIRHIDPVERRQGPELRTSFGRNLPV